MLCCCVLGPDMERPASGTRRVQGGWDCLRVSSPHRAGYYCLLLLPQSRLLNPPTKCLTVSEPPSPPSGHCRRLSVRLISRAGAGDRMRGAWQAPKAWMHRSRCPLTTERLCSTGHGSACTRCWKTSDDVPDMHTAVRFLQLTGGQLGRPAVSRPSRLTWDRVQALKI